MKVKHCPTSSVIGIERWADIADQTDAFLLRWLKYMLDMDRRADTEYAKTMRRYRAELQGFTETIRKDLFWHATDRPKNAFQATIDDAEKALSDLRLIIEKVLSERIKEQKKHGNFIPAISTGFMTKRTYKDLEHIDVKPISHDDVQKIVENDRKEAGFASQ